MSTLPSSWPEGPTLRLLDRADEPLVAPVEVAAAAPQAFLGFRCGLLRGLLARPGQDSRLGIDSRHVAVHDVCEACLLLGLEQWVVVEGIRVLVVTERHRLLELGVPLLQLEMILNDLGEDRRRLNLHTGSWARGLDGPAGEILALQTGFSTETAGELRSEEHTSELQSRLHLVCRLLLEKKKKNRIMSRALIIRESWSVIMFGCNVYSEEIG